MGKKKKEKVVDLKPEKISEEQLKKVQQIVNMMNRGQMDIGIMETRKHKIMHDIAAIQEQLTAMQGDFEKEYGTYDINIQDGTINYKKDEPSDS
tara:strand:- start:182 stop:463 length:282 start_codon:yes stop_codon:yes gene_type:complete